MYRVLIAAVSTAFLAACASTGSNYAAQSSASPDVKAEAPRILETDEFLAFLDTLEADLEEGEPRELNRMEMRRVNSISNDLRQMLDGIESVEQLNNNEQVTIYNKTQELWTTVVGRDEDQVICRREHRVGTNFKSTRCRTVQQIREDQRQASRYLQGIGPGPMPVLE